MTTIEWLQELVTACGPSPLVESYVVQTMDEDILSVRVHLQVNTFGESAFISVFYNVMTDKVAFALIVAGQRIYGKDIAKMGWHVHPFESLNQHWLCQSVSFGGFLEEVEAHYKEMNQ
jgi:hypothetical protein